MIDLSNPLGQVFGLMPPETQEAMKAHGGPWEYMPYDEGWRDIAGPAWHTGVAYRVKPAPIRETVTLYAGAKHEWQPTWDAMPGDTHKITFDLIDGKPDCASIKMEPLE
jgi:hypothetical protein